MKEKEKGKEKERMGGREREREKKGGRVRGVGRKEGRMEGRKEREGGREGKKERRKEKERDRGREKEVKRTDLLKTWMNVMLSEKSHHTQKATCFMIHSYGILTKANLR